MKQTHHEEASHGAFDPHRGISLRLDGSPLLYGTWLLRQGASVQLSKRKAWLSCAKRVRIGTARPAKREHTFLYSAVHIILGESQQLSIHRTDIIYRGKIHAYLQMHLKQLVKLSKSCSVLHVEDPAALNDLKHWLSTGQRL